MRGSVVGNQHNATASFARWLHDYGSQGIVFCWIGASTSDGLPDRQGGDASHVSGGVRTCRHQDGATESNLTG